MKEHLWNIHLRKKETILYHSQHLRWISGRSMGGWSQVNNNFLKIFLSFIIAKIVFLLLYFYRLVIYIPFLRYIDCDIRSQKKHHDSHHKNHPPKKVAPYTRRPGPATAFHSQMQLTEKPRTVLRKKSLKIHEIRSSNVWQTGWILLDSWHHYNTPRE